LAVIPVLLKHISKDLFEKAINLFNLFSIGDEFPATISYNIIYNKLKILIS